MKVYVSDELSLIGKELKNRGYDIMTKKNDIFDAVICNLKDGELNKLNINNNIKIGETIIIDCGKKNINDIEYILNNRSFNNKIS
ncbi:hypothetical protein J2Z42_002719 [Clostridium algifaecis]|uniref:RCK C-terminal domain-containing protein n=1 Tax=Clostridium algifaecis TaxID=1472040 RepID=A0ABS4KVD6_9CLOT|nr:YkuS family protein [Clostridium algifaecis]MBP2034002.1 hypothetical protein [Clostridium algifaecis]